MTRTKFMSGKNCLKYCFLFFFSALVVACTSNTNDLVFPGQDTTGTVEVHLNDPLRQFVPVELQQSLSFAGIDSFGNITYGPVTREFQNIVTLSGVPVQTSCVVLACHGSCVRCRLEDAQSAQRDACQRCAYLFTSERERLEGEHLGNTPSP